MQCFVALGGNIGNVEASLKAALKELAAFPNFAHSKVYSTSPVSTIEQADFLNMCCRFECALSPFELLSFLQQIETKLGKTPKVRDAPRKIDLDLLFCGEELIFEEGLVLPHPRWHERLFVLAPLADIVKTLPFGIDVQQFLANFPNHHKERVYEKSTGTGFLDR